MSEPWGFIEFSQFTTRFAYAKIVMTPDTTAPHRYRNVPDVVAQIWRRIRIYRAWIGQICRSHRCCSSLKNRRCRCTCTPLHSKSPSRGGIVMFPKSDVESDNGIGSGVVELVRYVVERGFCWKLVEFIEIFLFLSVEEMDFSCHGSENRRLDREDREDREDRDRRCENHENMLKHEIWKS